MEESPYQGYVIVHLEFPEEVAGPYGSHVCFYKWLLLKLVPPCCLVARLPAEAETRFACSELRDAPGQASEQGPVASWSRRHETVVRGLLSPVCLSLLSLRVSLLGWYFCLWKVQEDLVSCARLSLELCADMFFYWAQNLLLGCMLLLLLAWKASQRAQRCAQRQLQHSWRALERRFLAVLLRLLTCYWCLERLVVLIVWGPTYCITRVTSLLAWLLQAAFEHTLRVAGQAEEEAVEMVMMKTARGVRPHPALVAPKEPRFLGKEAKV
ncbi:transmembrane protein 270 [Emydura macquarii macquarii]|uniref:transmembrane protein 270 n=1 Tax=Emydura macquarii macquarii TaxID=1129001 RepID=UPI00352B3F0C